MKAALLALSLLAASAAAAWARPPGPAPDHAASAPPPAWISTAAGARWLGYSGYCWHGTGGSACVDVEAPRCSDARVPHLRMKRGVRARLHFGFRPTEVSLSLNLGHARRLRAVRTPSWRVRGRGVLLVTARGKAGDATYAACLRTTRAA